MRKLDLRTSRTYQAVLSAYRWTPGENAEWVMYNEQSDAVGPIADTRTPIRLIVGGYETANGFRGWIHELIFFDRKLNDDEFTAMQEYLAPKL